jgi:peptidoglycan/LPS O-acetylase OafA/YrhL
MSARIKELDGIRGLAILMVLVWHYWTCLIQVPGTGSPLAWFCLLTTAFGSGVDLFFVLSGFLIGGIILDNYDKPNFLKGFWIRRCARILPVLGLLLAGCWGLQRILDPVRYAWLFDQLMPRWSYLSFTKNILMDLHGAFGGGFLGIIWSLAVEEQFYLFASALILLMGRQVWVRSLPALIVAAIFLRAVFSGFYVRFVVSAGLAWISFHTVESFFLRIGQRYRYGQDPVQG